VDATPDNGMPSGYAAWAATHGNTNTPPPTPPVIYNGPPKVFTPPHLIHKATPKVTVVAKSKPVDGMPAGYAAWEA